MIFPWQESEYRENLFCSGPAIFLGYTLSGEKQGRFHRTRKTPVSAAIRRRVNGCLRSLLLKGKLWK